MAQKISISEDPLKGGIPVIKIQSRTPADQISQL